MTFVAQNFSIESPNKVLIPFWFLRNNHPYLVKIFTDLEKRARFSNRF
jgi:hypothetical protein